MQKILVGMLIVVWVWPLTAFKHHDLPLPKYEKKIPPVVYKQIKILCKRSWPMKRVAAARHLAQMASKARVVAPYMDRFLQDPSWEVRRQVVWTVAALQGKQMAAFMKKALRDEHVQVRIAAIQMIAQSRLTANLADLIAFYKRAASPLKSKILLSVAPWQEKAIWDLINQALLQNDPQLQAAALQASRFYPRRIKLAWLLSFLQSDKLLLRYHALVALGYCGDLQALSYIHPLLQAPQKQIRRAAVQALGRIGSTISAPHLERALKQAPGASLRYYCIQALAFCGRAQSVPLLIKELASPKASLRLRTAQTLQELISANKKYLAKTKHYLQNEKVAHVQAALLVCFKHQPALLDDKLVEKYTAHKHWQVRLAAYRVLAAAAVPRQRLLQRALKDENPFVVLQVKRLLKGGSS